MTKVDFKLIENVVGNSIKKHKYSIPIILNNKIDEIINNRDINDRRYARKIKTIKDACMFIIISIIHFNRDKNEYIGNENTISEFRFENINYKFDSELGCELSKEILTSVISNNIFYDMKNLLIENNIIKYVEINKDVYYSKKAKQAIKYIINKEYLNYKDIIYIENKYADKLAFLLKNNLVSYKKRHLLNKDKMPYENEEKNWQYKLQKQLIFDENEFKNIFEEKYKNIGKEDNKWEYIKNLNTLNIIKDENITNDMILDYKLFHAVNNHIFNASEVYGRIYMPFQYMNKIYRKALRYNSKRLKEVFDMKCGFIQIASILYRHDTKNLLDGMILYDLAKNDIYARIAEEEHISRDDAKSSLMEFMFENSFTRKHKKGNIHSSIVNFFKNKFPIFYEWLNNYKYEYSYEEEGIRCISLLSRNCSELESEIMFNTVIPYLRKKYKDNIFLTLHDGIWSTEDFKYEIKNDVEFLINRYNY